ncbi:ABC transporter substrate-binding protein [Legionella pneumophila]|uniref:Amino acid (Glutamine) ABC transporter, periplasmic amino acid binding protein n=1 Tax=Legionella pneumophila subsp. pascullei TaxID=91890 RepID=A0AAX2ISD5_LEGPN|nr:ABC transporter substrate-binding protein [Legionella pneumophila]AMP88635.1 amino acid ABC transporter substrate-binding protein [Legionella pneumophila subsp. pascullei]AMP91544.1 amino acid ABC transporter substrate-binding protein [Legionella pneumophila subsp. pascullei]AMP94530.1 amino acid ABC transporter substrate-binding protein [Legionella pneumophila subsp. pascullei]SQG89335.1 amino acid (glutamine) ABC transporter, periplasmic amino acid binding protein [Legionella pneumophila s
MKNIFLLSFISFFILISSCSEQKNQNILRFSTSAEYPPFEYIENGEIQGFDIDLAKLIAKELGKEAVFDNMQFSAVLPAVNSGQDDLAIATITITEERKKNFDFSKPYYFEGMAAVFDTSQPVKEISQLTGKKIAVQLGSVMEIWLHQHFPKAEITALDNNNQAIEALIAGHVDVVLMDGAQGSVYSKKYRGLSYSIIAKANEGYGVVLKKGSPLTDEINSALENLKAKGEIQKLESIWIKGSI